MVSSTSAFRFLVAASLGAASAWAEVAAQRSVGGAQIRHISSSSTADLVILDAGHEAGLREGMVCTVSRAGRRVGELLLVDLRPRAASALIIDLAPDLGFQLGDHVSVKTVSTR
ncbi:MAG: hypothetical protein MUE42_02840 [Opitutaceae bacterium]|jgi:hypothetical protein|nr:hypothetical protein [Opitutaceae bacterium]